MPRIPLAGVRAVVPRLLVTVFLAGCAGAGRNPAEPVTLAIVNARVWTADPSHPWQSGIAISGDRITAVGSSAAIRKLVRPETRVIDAAGGMVVPGFID